MMENIIARLVLKNKLTGEIKFEYCKIDFPDDNEFDCISKDLFTGINDKNGNKIFENDSVSVKKEGCSQIIQDVAWKNENRINYGHGESSITKYVGFSFIDRGTELENSDIEIVGNIYNKG